MDPARVPSNLLAFSAAREFGFVHTTYGYKASSGQMDARSPNVMNASKHTSLGQRFRRVVRALPSYALVETDVSAYHIC